MLEFLGTGGAYARDLGNNSAFCKWDNNLLMIDSGESTLNSAIDNNIFEGVENAYILITHFHTDHVGTLGSLIFHLSILNIKTTVIYPNKKNMNILLGFFGVSTRCSSVSPSEVTAFKVKEYKQVHENMEAYGYLISLNGKTVFYSGDAKSIAEEPLQMLLKGELDCFYQDLRENLNEFHLSFEEITAKIPMEYRKKVYCMHFDKSSDIPKIQALGFNTVKKTGLS